MHNIMGPSTAGLWGLYSAGAALSRRGAPELSVANRWKSEPHAPWYGFMVIVGMDGWEAHRPIPEVEDIGSIFQTLFKSGVWRIDPRVDVQRVGREGATSCSRGWAPGG